MSRLQARLVKFGAFGNRIGPLSGALSWTWTYAQYGYPTLEVTYPEAAARSSLLEEPCEIGIEIKDPATGLYYEPDNCRLIQLGRKWDRLDKTRVRTYRYVGMGFFLTRLLVKDADEFDPGDGPRPPIRSFTDASPGQIMVPLVNAAFARHSFGLGFAHPLDKNFELDEDANDVPWTLGSILPGTISVNVVQRLSDVERMLVDAAVAEPIWWKRTLRYYNWLTYGRDLTTGATIVTIRDAHNITAAPESLDYDDLAASILVVGSEGRVLESVGDDPDLFYGYLEDSMAAPEADSLDAMQMIARFIRRRGQVAAEQLTREGVASDDPDDPSPMPLVDYRVSDKVRLQRETDRGSDRFVKLFCTEQSITYTQGKGFNWHAKYGDRHQDRMARALALSYRNRLGTKGGKFPDPPGTDVRIPHWPVDVTVDTIVEADPNQKSKGIQTINWTNAFVVYNPDDPDDLTGEPINPRGTAIGEHRAGIITQIAIVGPEETSWTREFVEPGARDLVVATISKAGFYSPWSDFVPADVTRDPEPWQGKNLVLDDRFVMNDIREKRKAFAGTGFDFEVVSGRTRGVHTDTAPVLRTRIGGLSDSGYVPVREGEKYLVGATIRKVGAPAASQRVGVQWVDAAGTVTDDYVFTQLLDGTDTRYVDEWEVPTGALAAAWITTGASFGVGARTEIYDPVFERRTSTERIEDLSISLDKYIDRSISGLKIQLNTIEADHIVVGTLDGYEFNAIIINVGELHGGTIDAVTITGSSLETTSGIVISGSSIVVGGASLEWDGGGFLSVSSGAFFGGGVVVDGTLFADAAALGPTTTGNFGASGAAATGPVALASAATDLASAIALANSCRSALITKGLGS